MEGGFKPKLGIPENQGNNGPLKLTFTPEAKKEQSDLYLKWMAKMVLKGETDFSELRYTNEAIINESQEDINRAILFNHEDRVDLISKLKILKGDYEEAKQIILECKNKDLNEVMVEALFLLLKKSKEKREEIMREVEVKNPELIKYMNERGIVFITK